MKNLISLCALLALFAISCDSPLSNFQSNQLPTLSDAPAPRVSYSKEPIKPDTIRNAAWQAFKEKNGNDWRIRWNKHTGLPSSIFLGLTEKTYEGNPKEAAQNFLADNNALFGISDFSTLKYVKKQTHSGVTHVTFDQVVEGVPVYEAQLKVHIRSGGKVEMVNGTFYPSLKISTSPSLTSASAVDKAISDIKLAPNDVHTKAELVVFRNKERFHLAWKLIVFSENPMLNWLYFVDANSGDIIDRLNLISDITNNDNASSKSKPFKIFKNRYPNKTANTFSTKWKGRFNPVLGDGDIYPEHPDISSVTNKNIYTNGSGYLRGQWAYIINDEATEAYSSSNSWQYSSNNTHFDEVNLYYHIDRFRHYYLNSIGGEQLTLSQIKAHAHTPVQDLDGNGTMDPNAWFWRPDQELYFNDEYGSYNDFAKEDKVIYHEYTHAVIYNINNNIVSSWNEEGAISEGTPDYFAGSLTGRSEIGEYVISGGFRDMADPDYTDYSQLPRNNDGDVIVEPHYGGEFFSSILWDLYNTVGAYKMDLIVFSALYYLDAAPDFLEFRDAMMTIADNRFPNSPDLPAIIQNAFADKGVGTPIPEFEVSISGIRHIPAGSQGTWWANVSGYEATPPYSYQWYVNGAPSGTNSSYTYYSIPSEGGTQFDLKVTVTDNASNTDSHEMTVLIMPPH